MSEENGKHLHRGFIPVMLMPFKDKGEIDYEALKELVEFYIKAGAVGLFANCLSSEMFELTPGEQINSTRFIIDTAKGRVPVVATGNFGDTIPKQAESVKRMRDTGVEAVILITSLLASKYESDEVLGDNAKQLMDLTGNIPLGFYECPVPYKRVLSASQLASLLVHDRVVYYKDTSLDIHQVEAKINTAKGSDFRLYDAYLGHAVASLRAGSHGLSCIQGNFFPEVIVWVCNNFDNPTLKNEVDQVQKFLIDNMDVMHAAYPLVAKYFLRKRGMKISTVSRINNEPLAAGVKVQIDKLYDEYLELKSSLKIA